MRVIILKFILGFALAGLLAVSATGKTPEWDTQLDNALSETDSQERLKRLQSLLEATQDPEQTIILSYYLGQTHIDRSHFG